MADLGGRSQETEVGRQKSGDRSQNALTELSEELMTWKELFNGDQSAQNVEASWLRFASYESKTNGPLINVDKRR